MKKMFSSFVKKQALTKMVCFSALFLYFSNHLKASFISNNFIQKCQGSQTIQSHLDLQGKAWTKQNIHLVFEVAKLIFAFFLSGIDAKQNSFLPVAQ